MDVRSPESAMASRDPRIDAYIAKSADFARPILTHLREAVHAACPQVEETLKWNAPAFMHGGKILCSMAAFKQHAAFGFWQGAQVVEHDPKAAEAMGQFGRITGLADLPGKAEFTRYAKRAMKLIDEGVKPLPTKTGKPKPPPAPPSDLAAALKKNKQAQVTFNAFPPSQQREYIEWITEAKREETRQKRLVQAIEWLSEGKPRNWKYMHC